MASPKYSAERFKRYNNVFDKKTLRNLFKLSSEGYFAELAEPVALGKEANVFTAEREDGTFVIVKIYRVENSNFNKMYYYIQGDKRFDRIENHRRKIVFSWVQREYRNLLLARDHVDVPTPYTVKDNILVMQLIGENGGVAPQVKDVDPRKPEAFFKRFVKQFKGLMKAGLVHGDLSHFNTLNWKERPYVIDMGQATPIDTVNAKDLFERDLENMEKYYKKYVSQDLMDKSKKMLTAYFEEHHGYTKE